MRLLANGSPSSNHYGEGDISRALIQADFVYRIPPSPAGSLRNFE